MYVILYIYRSRRTLTRRGYINPPSEHVREFYLKNKKFIFFIGNLAGIVCNLNIFFLFAFGIATSGTRVTAMVLQRCAAFDAFFFLLFLHSKNVARMSANELFLQSQFVSDNNNCVVCDDWCNPQRSFPIFFLFLRERQIKLSKNYAIPRSKSIIAVVQSS